jgi:hypothetical protein
MLPSFALFDNTLRNRADRERLIFLDPDVGSGSWLGKNKLRHGRIVWPRPV